MRFQELSRVGIDRDLIKISFSFLLLLLIFWSFLARWLPSMGKVMLLVTLCAPSLSSLLLLLEKFFSSAILMIPVPHGAPDAGADRLLISARVLQSADGMPELHS